jgi:predicted DNA-binding protein
VHLDTIEDFYLAADALLNCLKNNFKIDIKTASAYFGVTTTITERTILSC